MKKLDKCSKILEETKDIDNIVMRRILQIIIDKKIKYEENSSGCHIDLKKCNIKTLDEILDAIEKWNDHKEYNEDINKSAYYALQSINKEAEEFLPIDKETNDYELDEYGNLVTLD